VVEVAIAGETDKGLVIIDGYHRVAALKRNVAITSLESTGILTDEMTPREREKRIQDLLKAEDDKDLEKLLYDTLIKAEIGDYKNDNAVFKAALTANLKHGLPPKSKALIHIALAYYDVTRGEVPEPSQSEIARIVGISRAALNEYLQKRKKEEEKQETEEEDGSSSQDKEKAQEDRTKKEVKKAEAFLKSLEKLFQEDHFAHTRVIETLFPAITLELASEYSSHNDGTYKDLVFGLLTSDEPLTSAHAMHIAKLGKALTATSKKIESTNETAKEKARTPQKTRTPQTEVDVPFENFSEETLINDGFENVDRSQYMNEYTA
ncbi:MAG TPA: hypothetical protein VEP90_25530, partial [Methylomirabilota bacterium]|nr:hypothetical protein [Methylomirabilota bacterium]